MPKKCIICGKEAKFKISGTNDYYCEECAIEYFGDVSCLVKVEEEAKKIRDLIKERLDDDQDIDVEVNISQED